METRSTDQDGSAASFTTGRLKVEWTSGSADNLVIDSKWQASCIHIFFAWKIENFYLAEFQIYRANITLRGEPWNKKEKEKN